VLQEEDFVFTLQS